MAQYTNPGIYVTESPFATSIVTGPTTTAAAFLGTALRGPSVPVSVDSWNSFKAQFGDVSSSYELGYAVYHFFANGGRTAYVSRVVGASAVAATVNVTGTFNGAAGTTLFKLNAKNVGVWGNGLSVTITAGLLAGNTPTFNAVVIYNGAEVERWSELSLAPDDSRYVPNVINNYSSYLSVSNFQNFVNATYSVTNATLTPSTGADGASLVDNTVAGTQSAWSASLNNFNQINGQLLFNLVGISNSTIINNAINYVENRGNSFLIIDPLTTATNTNVISSTVAAYTKSSYAAVYYPMLQMSNPAASGTAALRNTYPGGAIAGLYTRVDTERGVAKAPAGYAYEVRNVFGLTTPFTESEVGTLYTENINTLKAIPGAGVVVNGARTLKQTDITKYIPVRRSLNFIKANIDGISQFAVFEPNGERLWAELTAKISNFLSSFWASGGLKGRSAAEAYFITCDATNNTNTSIEQGQVNIAIGVSLQSPAEFIVINISQFIGGNNVRETL
jgi:phage tail sheath protein FI